jgi:FkbM family methyltransferase
MSNNEYKLKVRPKTRIVNFFRRVFTFALAERFLVKMTTGRPASSFWVRLMPPNYLYPKGSRRLATRNGIKYDLDISDYMEHAVYFAYRDEALEALLVLAQGCRVIIDVGVNIGATSLNLAKLPSTELVLGFEPDKRNFEKAQTNLRLNEFGNVRFLNHGLGPESCVARLYRVNSDNKGMNRILSKTANQFDFEEVRIKALDEVIADEPLMVDMIKIDVEGYELKVLRGAVETINRCRPKLFIELDDDNLRSNGDSASELVRLLTDFDYQIKPILSDTLLTPDMDFSGCHMDIICINEKSSSH